MSASAPLCQKDQSLLTCVSSCPESVYELWLQIPKNGDFAAPTAHGTGVGVRAECGQDEIWGRLRSVTAPPM